MASTPIINVHEAWAKIDKTFTSSIASASRQNTVTYIRPGLSAGSHMWRTMLGVQRQRPKKPDFKEWQKYSLTKPGSQFANISFRVRGMGGKIMLYPQTGTMVRAGKGAPFRWTMQFIHIVGSDYPASITTPNNVISGVFTNRLDERIRTDDVRYSKQDKFPGVVIPLWKNSKTEKSCTITCYTGKSKLRRAHNPSSFIVAGISSEEILEECVRELHFIAKQYPITSL